MPNGGSDCCGTCRFSNKYDASIDQVHFDKSRPTICTIRNVEVEKPFWTYCANHDYHNPQKISFPIGPVYKAGNYPYDRVVWENAPDTEEIRVGIFKLLDEIDENLKFEYVIAISLEEEIIKQVQEYKDPRSIKGLLKVTQLDISNYRLYNGLQKGKNIIVAQAVEALLYVSDGKMLSEVQHFISLGLDEELMDPYIKEQDGFAPVRYHLVRGLSFCEKQTALPLLRKALHDPHDEVRLFAAQGISEYG